MRNIFCWLIAKTFSFLAIIFAVLDVIYLLQLFDLYSHKTLIIFIVLAGLVAIGVTIPIVSFFWRNSEDVLFYEPSWKPDLTSLPEELSKVLYAMEIAIESVIILFSLFFDVPALLFVGAQ